MFKKFFKRPSPIPQQLYGAVVAQSRLPVFYTDLGFEDTPMGRFDSLSLHLFLFSRRLVREDTKLTTSLNQEVFDIYTQDIDVALRTLGVGDPTVPKRKKKMVRSYYGQIEDFANLLDDNNLKELKKAVTNRFFAEDKKSAKVSSAVANYMMSCGEVLDDQPAETILAGTLSWPDVSKLEAK